MTELIGVPVANKDDAGMAGVVGRWNSPWWELVRYQAPAERCVAAGSPGSFAHYGVIEKIVPPFEMPPPMVVPYNVPVESAIRLAIG